MDKIKINRISHALEFLPTPNFIKSRHGVYVAGNSRWSQGIMGLGLEDIIGKTVFDFPGIVPYAFAQLHHDMDQKLLVGQDAVSYEASIHCADGDRRRYKFFKEVIKDRKGLTQGLSCTMADISDIKEAQQILKEEAAQIRKLHDNDIIGVYVTSLEGDIRFANNKVQEMFGYSSEELSKMKAGSFYENPKDRRDLTAKLARDGYAFTDLKLIRKDGSRFRASCTANSQGGIIRGYLSEIKGDMDYLIAACAWCNKARYGNQKDGEWIPWYELIQKPNVRDKIKEPFSRYEVTHGICPQCADRVENSV